MRKFSVRPSITVRGRKFNGLRGWSGKPFHPPLTDVPIGAYILAAVFDIISVFGRNKPWGQDFSRAATYALIGGVIVSVFAAMTGFVDRQRSSTPGNQARRTINTHAIIMVIVTVAALVDVVIRLARYDTDTSTPVALTVLTVIVAGLVSWGATYGGTLVFDYGFNVETAGDSPVWHPSETDVLPGEH